MLGIIKSKIKNNMRRVLPANLYTRLYYFYAKSSHMNISDDKIKSYAGFVKEGSYDFRLDDVKFKIQLNPGNGGVDAEIYADGCYEPHMLKLIRDILSKSENHRSVFVDVGANIGQHSLWASHYASHVYSFEPIKSLYHQFTGSAHINKFLNISIYNYALGNAEDIVPIYGSSANMGGSSLVSDSNRVKIQDIRVIRLDDEYKRIGIDSCKLMKIDVEGYELEVLLGARDLLLKYKPAILLEYSPTLLPAGHAERLYKFLKDLGYKISDIDEGRDVRSFEDIADNTQRNLLCEA